MLSIIEINGLSCKNVSTYSQASVSYTHLQKAVDNYLDTDYKEGYGAPDASTYGVWVPGPRIMMPSIRA